MAKKTYTEGFNDGYSKALSDFDDKMDWFLGSEDRDIYCKEIFREIIDELLTKKESEK